MTKPMMLCIALLVAAVLTFFLTRHPSQSEAQHLLDISAAAIHTPTQLDHATTLVSVEAKPGLRLVFTYEMNLENAAFTAQIPELTRQVKAAACGKHSLVITHGTTDEYRWMNDGRLLLDLSFRAKDC